MGIVGGGRNRNPLFRYIRIGMLLMLILAAVVFKGHGQVYTDIRIGYWVLLAGFLLFGGYFANREREEHHHLPSATPPPATGEVEPE